MALTRPSMATCTRSSGDSPRLEKRDARRWASPVWATSTTKPLELAAETASFDLAVGLPTRYLVGVFTADKQTIAYGALELRFCFLGATKATGPCQLGELHAASFLPTPGTDIPPGKT